MDGLDLDTRMDVFIGEPAFECSDETYGSRIPQVYVPIELKKAYTSRSATMSSLLKYIEACCWTTKQVIAAWNDYRWITSDIIRI